MRPRCAGSRARPNIRPPQGWSIAGPDSRELLSRLTDVDVSSEGFRFRDLREMTVGGLATIAARLSFTGELGYELYCTEDGHDPLCQPPVRQSA